MSRTPAKQHKASSSRLNASLYCSALVLSLLCTTSSYAIAGTSCMGTNHSGPTATCVYDPTDTRNPTDTTSVFSNYKTSVSGGAQATMTGTMNFVPGETGFEGVITLNNMKPKITSITPQAGLPTAMDDLLAMESGTLGLRTGVAVYNDIPAGEHFTISVFQNTDISAPILGDTTVDTFKAVQQNQYTGLRLGEVDNTGGTLTVETAFQNASGTMNNIHIAAKNSTLFLATGGAGAESKIIWNATNPTNINMAAAATEDLDAETMQKRVSDWPTSVSVTLMNGTIETHPITDIDDLHALNTKLIEYLESGEIEPRQSVYDNYLNQALNLKTVSIAYEKEVSGNPALDDLIHTPNGTKIMLHATGVGASLEVTGQSTLNGHALSSVLRADNGATITNDGTVGVSIGTGISLSSGTGPTDPRTSGTNTGVVYARYWARGAELNNADFHNTLDGIINVEVSDDSYVSYGIYATNNSEATNDGIINVGTNAGGTYNGSSHGAYINNSTFTNTGTIYVGRAAQTDASDIVADTSIQAANPFTAITVLGNSTIVNTGDIHIGSKADGIDAIRIENTNTAKVTQTGDIYVAGDTIRTKLNTAFNIINSGGLDANGDNLIQIGPEARIVLTGANATGVNVLTQNGQRSRASMNGEIIVDGMRNPNTGTRNHGVWVISEGTGESTVDVTGKIRLTGVGAIGLHARGNSTINVEIPPNSDEGGEVIFESGTDQIGYFLYGEKAAINVLRTDLTVGTERSNLFRIEGGAEFGGRNYHVTVSGKDAIGVLGIGTGSVVDIENGLYDVTGEGATAIHISGGAKGWIYNDAKINLNAFGTQGAVVDGHGYNIYGARIETSNSATALNSSTDIDALGEEVIGFTVKNNAKLHYASAEFLSRSHLSSNPNIDERLFAIFRGDNSIAFKGENSSTFEINNMEAWVNGWVFDLNNGTHKIDLITTKAVGMDGFLRNVTTSGQPTSTANLTLDDAEIYGIITTDAASITNLTLDEDSRWITAGDSNLTDLTNEGFISLPGTTWDGVFRTLTVSNNYEGTTDSGIHMRVALDDGLNPLTDKLILENTKGDTILFIQNAGGQGKKTVGDGIEIIEVNGTADGNFMLGSRLFAGAYEYELFEGAISITNNNWYLRSTGFRPEVPIYSAANSFISRFGNEMIGTYRDRYGHADTNPELERGWGRAFGTFGDARQKRKDPDADTQTFFKYGSSYSYDMGGFQTGIDLLRRGGDGASQDSAGIYIGAGHGVANVNHVFNGKAGKLRQNAYSVGAYWTRTGEDKNWYVDGLIQATYYDLNSTTFLHMTDSTHGMGYAASLEAGYNIPLTSSNSWSIEPQAQLVYQYTTINNITDYAGKIHFNDTNNLYGRLGAHLVTRQNVGGSQPLKAWLRADVWQDLSQKTHTEFLTYDNDLSAKIKNKPLGTWGQVGLGVSGHVTDHVSLFASGDYSHNISNEKQHGWNGRVGMTIQW